MGRTKGSDHSFSNLFSSPYDTVMLRLDESHFLYNYDAGTSGPYINYREVFARFELSPGAYVIIPATFEADCPSHFMIRVYSQKNFSLKALK